MRRVTTVRNSRFIWEKGQHSHQETVQYLTLYGIWLKKFKGKTIFYTLTTTLHLYLLQNTCTQSKSLCAPHFALAVNTFLKGSRNHRNYKEVNRWTFQSARLSNLTTTIWSDTRFVRFLSTLNRPDIETKCVRLVGSRRIEVTQPASACSYGKNYSAVDKFDRLCSHRVYGSLGHGSNKVWKHLLFHLTNMAIANAWILFCETSTRPRPKYYDHMAFRHELATELIGGFSSRKKSTASTSVNLHASVLDNMSGHERTCQNACKETKTLYCTRKIPAEWTSQERNYLWLLSV